MPTAVVPGTPLADALQNVAQTKLVEMGWSTGGLDDSALAEYIMLNIVNGKTQEEIALELANDLLGLAPEDTAALNFMKWLFEQIDVLSGVPAQNGGNGTNDAPSTGMDPESNMTETVNEVQNNGDQDVAVDTEMDIQQDGSIPTGPKSMRNGSQAARDRRMLGHVNKQLNDAALHKVKGSAGTGRINSHRIEPPKGPRQQNRAQALQRGMQRGPGMAQQMQQQNNMGQMPGIYGAMGPMTPQQQMQMFALYEEQARMMASILSPQQQSMFPAQMAFADPNTPQPQQGKSLFDRVDNKRPPHNKRNYNNNNHINGQQSATAGQDSITIDPSSSMDVEGVQSTPNDPSTTICYFNLNCTKADCHFVHQSPAAPPGTTIDMGDTCSFGAACKNHKCVGKHPSPAKLAPARAQEDCKFYPNCTNPRCPFKHPAIPPCRNGADCTVPNCKFAHNTVACKFDPCLNPACPFKHAAGQKRGTFQDKVWSASGEHVSDRKFVNEEEGAQEDLILPGKDNMDSQDTVASDGIIV